MPFEPYSGYSLPPPSMRHGPKAKVKRSKRQRRDKY